jgi:protein TonB
MRSASLQHSSYLDRVSIRSRITAFLLSLAVSILIVVMLLRLGAMPPHAGDAESRLVTIRLLPEAGSPHKRAATVAKVKRATRRVPPPPLPPPPIPPLNMLILSREEFAAADIANMPSHAAEGSGVGKGSGETDGPGEGPGGERLYNAEWYREPTHAELAGYLPAGRMQAQWGMIACRTVEKYRVEDCHELAEAPAGSGLARALRQAAWQFLVRPPRIGGRPVIGAWVRIRFDFTHEGTK